MHAHGTDFPPVLVSVAAFLKRREPWLAKTPRERLLAFLLWYWRQGLVGIVREHGRVVAVALARCVERVEDAAQEYHHDEHGRIVWVDHIASRHPEGVPVLLRQTIQRFGRREAFAGNVFKRAGELRMLPFQVVERLSTGGTTHG